MTFDEWADSHDLMDHERRLCKEYLMYLRTSKWLRCMVTYCLGEEEPDDAR